MNLDSLDFTKYIDIVVELAIGYGPKLLLALLTLVIGFRLVKLLIKALDKAMTHQKIDPSLRSFLDSLISTVLKILILIPVASMIGIQMTSFVALLGAAGLAVGLALQGSLANLAGGVLILFFKPFKVHDMIEVNEEYGEVQKIQIFNTTLITRDGRTLIIPNGDLSNGMILNYSTAKRIRVSVQVGIGYQDDIAVAKEALLSVAKKNTSVVDNPAPFVGVAELGDSAVVLELRVWAPTKQHRRLRFELYEAMKLALDEKSISIPYPQRDVHLYSEKK